MSQELAEKMHLKRMNMRVQRTGCDRELLKHNASTADQNQNQNQNPLPNILDKLKGLRTCKSQKELVKKVHAFLQELKKSGEDVCKLIISHVGAANFRTLLQHVKAKDAELWGWFEPFCRDTETTATTSVSAPKLSKQQKKNLKKRERRQANQVATFLQDDKNSNAEALLHVLTELPEPHEELVTESVETMRKVLSELPDQDPELDEDENGVLDDVLFGLLNELRPPQDDVVC